MKQPVFLAKLITSPAYSHKNSDEFARANKYMNLLYPGKINFDTSGNMIQPQYDMTLEQFQTAQFELDSDFENAKQEAEDAIQTEYGEYFDNLGIDFDIDNYVIQSEAIAVKVLYPAGNIITRNLLIYDLNIPNFAKQPKIWRWHSEGTDGTCDECAALDETVFFEESDIPEIPVHPNCRCYITEETIDDHGNTIKSKVYKTGKNQNAHQPIFERPVNTEPGTYAKFDGRALTIYQNNKEIYKFDARSGKPEYQDPKYQNLPNQGPIPEGAYVARQSEIQHITPYGLLAGIVNAGTWKGSLYSWGNSRVWLEPSNTTNTYGRDGFSIHGGLFPGSAGCIDLTGQINMFISWLESTGKDLIIYVEY